MRGRPGEGRAAPSRLTLGAIVAAIGIAILFLVVQFTNSSPADAPTTTAKRRPQATPASASATDSVPQSGDKTKPPAIDEAPPEPDNPVTINPDIVPDGREPRTHSRYRRDVARMFALAPLGVESSHVERHIDLNPVDALFTPEQQEGLAALLEEQKKLLEAQENNLGARRHTELMKLMHRRQLKPLTLASLSPEAQEEVLELARHLAANAPELMEKRRQENPELELVKDSSLLHVTGALKQLARKFVPNASAFVLHKGVMHMATDEQMEVLSEEVLTTHSARRSFLYAVLAWFVKQGFTTPDRVSLISEKFEHWIQKA